MTKIKQILQTTILAGIIGASVIAEEVKANILSQIQKPSVVLTRIQNDGAEPINRIEIAGKLPYNLDYYGLAQEQADVDFYKARLQFVPLGYSNFGLGAVVQHKNSNSFPEQNVWGIVGRLQGKPTKQSFGKIDLRYFPDKETFDWYGFLDTPRVFADCLGDYSPKTKRGFIQPGIDFKFGKTFSLGLEAKFTGEPSDLEKKYVGIRAKLKF